MWWLGDRAAESTDAGRALAPLAALLGWDETEAKALSTPISGSSSSDDLLASSSGGGEGTVNGTISRLALDLICCKFIHLG